MTTNGRDTHFQGFADLLFPEISKLFFTMYARILEHRQIEEIDAIEDEIRTLIAQGAYDLAIHVLSHANERMNLKLTNIKAWVDLGIPDLTEWPTRGSPDLPEQQ